MPQSVTSPQSRHCQPDRPSVEPLISSSRIVTIKPRHRRQCMSRLQCNPDGETVELRTRSPPIFDGSQTDFRGLDQDTHTGSEGHGVGAMETERSDAPREGSESARDGQSGQLKSHGSRYRAVAAESMSLDSRSCKGMIPYGFIFCPDGYEDCGAIRAETKSDGGAFRAIRTAPTRRTITKTLAPRSSKYLWKTRSVNSSM